MPIGDFIGVAMAFVMASVSPSARYFLGYLFSPITRDTIGSGNVYSNERVISDKGNDNMIPTQHYTTRKDFSWLRALVEATFLLGAARIVGEVGSRPDIACQAS
jgi:hypothetical protein